MGIGDLFTRLFFGKKNSHFFASEEKQKSNVMKVANGLVPVMNGTVKERDGGEEVHVTGEYGGFPARVILNVTFGGAKFELKTDQACPLFILMHDEKGREAYAGDNANKDGWDDDDDDEQKVFVSEHVYFEGDDEELVEMKAFWERFPAEAKPKLIEKIEESKGTFVCDSTGKLESSTGEGIIGLGDEVARARQYLDVLTSAASGLS